jgi:transposase
MTNTNPPIDILSGPERRRRWTAAEKVAIVNETYEPGVTVSWSPAGTALLQTSSFTGASWPPRALDGGGRGEEVVPASDYRALQNQVRELQRLLGKKTLEAEVFREALEVVDSKNGCCGPSHCRRTVPDECRREILGVAAPTSASRQSRKLRSRGPAALAGGRLVEEIKANVIVI